MLLFAEITPQLRGMLLGSVIIVVLGIFDDIYSLPAMFKFVVQIVAALVAVFSGNVIQTLSNPNIFSSDLYWDLGVLSIPVSVIWIVAITNAVNLIDGLDGLACGRIHHQLHDAAGHLPGGVRRTGGHSDGRPCGELHRLSAL